MIVVDNVYWIQANALGWGRGVFHPSHGYGLALVKRDENWLCVFIDSVDEGVTECPENELLQRLEEDQLHLIRSAAHYGYVMWSTLARVLKPDVFQNDWCDLLPEEKEPFMIRAIIACTSRDEPYQVFEDKAIEDGCPPIMQYSAFYEGVVFYAEPIKWS